MRLIYLLLALSADVIQVTTAEDGPERPGSLREAITIARHADGDTIVLQPDVEYVLDYCEGGALHHYHTPLTIEGNGATIRQTCPGHRVLEQGNARMVLTNVTITGGSTEEAGAGVRTQGDLEVV